MRLTVIVTATLLSLFSAGVALPHNDVQGHGVVAVDQLDPDDELVTLDTREDVVHLEQRNRGVPGGRLAISGFWGARTRATVLHYQRHWTPSFIDPDYVDADLLGRLLQKITYGSKLTDYVRALQSILRMWGHDIPVDGDLGEKTYYALRVFQSKRNFEWDAMGWVGACTWSFLFGGKGCTHVA
ncbi:hypothetical protein Q8F55_003297 [Vanrija albida]|uniref:Peptidoglycan binding-like domain-containing protein n=1 Tax=Vanrija albida TaxID=181172 RepID=A0ABR3Q3L0_9TREE